MSPRRKSWFDTVWLIFVTVLCLAIALFACTDAWPFMHEVIWQHSWHPVCPLPNGGLEFCKP